MEKRGEEPGDWLVARREDLVETRAYRFESVADGRAGLICRGLIRPPSSMVTVSIYRDRHLFPAQRTLGHTATLWLAATSTFDERVFLPGTPASPISVLNMARQ